MPSSLLRIELSSQNRKWHSYVDYSRVYVIASFAGTQTGFCWPLAPPEVVRRSQHASRVHSPSQASRCSLESRSSLSDEFQDDRL